MNKEKTELSDEDLEGILGGYISGFSDLGIELKKRYGMKEAGPWGGPGVETLCGGYGQDVHIRRPKSEDDILNYGGISYHPVFAHIGWHQGEVIWSYDSGKKFLIPTGICIQGM